MKDERKKLIIEIAGVAELLSTFPPQFQMHIQDMVGELVTDPEFYDGIVQIYNQQRDTVGPVSNEVRREELKKAEMSAQYLPFFQTVMQMLTPLAEKPGTRQDHRHFVQ